MHQHWKSVLYDYVRTHNQMEIDYTIEPILPFLSDNKYIGMQQQRLSTLKKWHKLRGVIPQKNETRVKILQVQESDHEVIVDLALKIQFIYDLRRYQHQADRIEKMRITICRNEANWIITKLDIQPQEKLSSPQSNQTTLEKTEKSTPYLNQSIFSRNPSFSRQNPYDRAKVKVYADRWWDHPNPEFIHFDVDCTNYVSQCLFAGNAPMNYTGNRASGWWYQGQSKQEQWSYSWSVSHSLQWLLASSKAGLRAELVSSADQLTIGDVIIYDWDNNGKYQHSVIVAAMDASGMPLVNAHTSNSRHRYWDYRDSYAWSEATKYRFFHIADSF